MSPSTQANEPAQESWVAERMDCWKRSATELPIVILFAAAATGVLVEEYAAVRSSILFPSAILALGMIALAWSKMPRFRWSFLWIGTSLFFAAMHGEHLRQRSSDRSHALATDEWSPVVFEGTIDAVPRWRPDLLQYEMQTVEKIEQRKWQTIIELEIGSVRDRDEWRPAAGRVTLTVDGNLRDYLPGERVRVFGKWQRIPKPTNPGQFDLAAHYRRKGQYVRVRSESIDQVQKLGTDGRMRLDRWMGWILEKGDRAIHRYVSLDQSTLASALVLGQRDQVEWELQESLLATGTMHMLAISGLHVEMVALTIVTLALLVRLPRKLTLLVMGCFVVCYGVLCGAQPPVIRAVVLVVAVCAARWMGRATHSMNLLALAGVILLCLRTSNLFDVGTQLSFIAVAMLSMLSSHYQVSERDRDPLKQLIYESRPPWQRGLLDLGSFSFEMIRTSMWVWLVTTPLVLSTFHVISPIAILLNLLLWLPLLIALLSGLGIVVVGTWLPPAGFVLGIFCGVSLKVTAWIIEWSEEIPASHWWIPAPSLSWTLLFYILLLGLWTLLGFSKVRRPIVAMALFLWCFVGMVPSAFGPHGKIPIWKGTESKPLRLTFVDVGHGSAVIIQCPDESTWLYDAGRLGDGERSFQNIAGVLWYEGLARIDGIFLSHADSDHYNAIGGLSKRFMPNELATTSQVLSHSSSNLRTILKGLERERVELNLWSEGGERMEGGVAMRALHPPAEGVKGSDNANSLCLMLEYAGRKIFLTGDLESPGTELLIKNHEPTWVDVLMAPHHGSVTQNPKPLLEWCRPSIVTVSGGTRAISKKVIEAYTASDRLLLITHRDGAIRVEVAPNGQIRTRIWKDSNWVLPIETMAETVRSSGLKD